MKIIIFTLFLFLTFSLKSQNIKKNDSIPLINDYSNFKGKNQTKFKIILFEEVPKDSSLVILDGKIYQKKNIDIRSLNNLRPILINKVIDSASNSGIKYIYFYKSN